MEWPKTAAANWCRMQCGGNLTGKRINTQLPKFETNNGREGSHYCCMIYHKIECDHKSAYIFFTRQTMQCDETRKSSMSNCARFTTMTTMTMTMMAPHTHMHDQPKPAAATCTRTHKNTSGVFHQHRAVRLQTHTGTHAHIPWGCRYVLGVMRDACSNPVQHTPILSNRKPFITHIQLSPNIHQSFRDTIFLPFSRLPLLPGVTTSQ